MITALTWKNGMVFVLITPSFLCSVPQLLAIRYWAIPVTVRMIALILAEMCVDLVLYSTLHRKNHSDFHH